MTKQSDTSFSRRDAVRLAGIASLGALFGGVSRSIAQEPVVQQQPTAHKQGAGFYSTKVGDIRVSIVSDGGFQMDAVALFPKSDAAAVDAAAQASFTSSRTIPGHVNTLLVQGGGATILVDTGCGTNFGPTTGALLDNLARAGVMPNDVTHVLITHAHPDHIGGLLDATGASRFAKAQVILSEAEHAFWTADKPDFGASLLPPEMQQGMTQGAKKTLAAIAKQLATRQPDDEIAGILKLVDAAGHTPGHVGLRIRSGDAQMLYVTDAVHMPSVQLANPTWQIAFDTDPELAASARKKLLDLAADEKLLVAGAHLPFPAFGYLTRAGDGYGWTPKVWEW